MKAEPHDVARWAAMQDEVAKQAVENRAKQREAKPTGPRNADGTDHGKGDSRHEVTNTDLDAMQARRAEGVEDAALRGEMAFAKCIGAAPSLVAAFQRLKARS